MSASKSYIPEAYLRGNSALQAEAEREQLLSDVAKKNTQRAERSREVHRVKWWEKKTPEVPGEK